MLNWRRPILQYYDAHITHNPIPGYVAFLDAAQTWPVAWRRQAQAEKLSQLLQHASRHVPYYRDLLDQTGVVHGDDVDLTRFSALPELTREILRKDFNRLKSDDLDGRAWYTNATGGSTGEPVVVLQDREYNDIGRAAIEMHYGWAGRNPGEPFVTLWGSEREILLGTEGWRNNLSNFIRNRTFLNSWSMSRADLQRYTAMLLRVRPVIIEAYAESAYELARYLNEAQVRVPGVRGVITSAGTLYPFIREEVERAFDCPVFNRYGSREVGSFAAERVPHAGLEVFTYTHLVEVVDAHGRPCEPGEEGDVLVTCLTNYAMPLIRYRLGDRAVAGTTVSSPTPSVERLQTVTGRIVDTFVRRDGTTVPSSFFMHFLQVVHNGGWLKKTQVVQEDYDRIGIKMVTTQTPPPATLDAIRQSIRRVMGADCRVEFEFVDAIPPSASGKYRYIVSLLPRADALATGS